MPETFVELILTTADTTKPLHDTSLFFHDVNIHINTNPVYYGAYGVEPTQSIPAGSILTFRDVDARDILFKNVNSGNNATIRAIGSVKL